jgi:hypothetical protein
MDSSGGFGTEFLIFFGLALVALGAAAAVWWREHDDDNDDDDNDREGG